MDWKTFWNKTAQENKAEAQVARIVNGQLMKEDLMDKIASKISLQLSLDATKIVLDVCCGNGQLSYKLLPFCKEVIGVDFSETLIKQAQSLPPSHLKFHLGSAENFGLNQEFDAVLLYFSFQYFESYELGKQVIENLVKHAKPGSKILIGDITDKRKFFAYYNTPKRLFALFKQTINRKNDMGKFWHPNELFQICKELNLKGKIQEQEPWQPYSHYRFDFLIEK
jgi:2-polyprenyl-3-methyl-5-hydroxy-6-metoxy-1,4-benzoquinol methylase